MIPSEAEPSMVLEDLFMAIIKPHPLIHTPLKNDAIPMPLSVYQGIDKVY